MFDNYKSHIQTALCSLRLLTQPSEPKHLHTVMITLIVFTMSGIAFATSRTTEPKPWGVSIRKAHVENPVEIDDQTLELGRALYVEHCITCHGDAGHGDGEKAEKLEVETTDFTIPAMWAQTDGELFYKITKGRKPMPGYKRSMSDRERWRVVHYIRSLSTKPEVVPSVFRASSEQREAISKALQAYQGVRALLLRNDASNAKVVGEAMSAAIAALSDFDASKMPKDAAKSWKDGLKKLVSAASDVATADGSNSLQKSFGELSIWLADFVRQFGYSESDALFLFSTTMSDDSTNIWLQTEGDPSNPYGSKSSSTTLLHTLGAHSMWES